MKDKKLEEMEKELEFAKMMYSANVKARDDLLKSLLYLEWKVDQLLKQSKTTPPYKENKEMKYHREQSTYIYENIKNDIHNEMSKYFNGENAKCFEYVSYTKWVNAGFAGKTIID